jgi:predicted ATPase
MVFLKNLTVTPEKDELKNFPFNIPAFSLDEGDLELELKSSVTFFVGENGSGKSTLLEAIAEKCKFGHLGGNRNHFSEGENSSQDLASSLKLSWGLKLTDGFFLRAESFFDFASYIDGVTSGQGYGGELLHEQSHGESFLSLFKHKFKQGMFLLDEPEAALSPNRQLSFLAIIHELEQRRKSQFIIATHSPILLSYPGATILQFGDDGIKQVRYEETEHYKVTKQFLDSPERFFRHLFSSDE